VPIGNFVVDFACLKARLIVEVDGGGHTRDGEAQSDKRRDMILEQLDYRILRFWNSEVQANIDGVIETIILSARQTPAASHLFASAEPKPLRTFRANANARHPPLKGRDG
jgi:very-short-patch-repair endonuclease